MVSRPVNLSPVQLDQSVPHILPRQLRQQSCDVLESDTALVEDLERPGKSADVLMLMRIG
jgi:hypothetical protein